MSQENELRIVGYDWQEQNPFADPDKANNGGGYSQPEIIIQFSDGVIIRINDTSCGDFGSRIDVGICENGGNDCVAFASYGTMYEDSEQTYSTIGEKYGEYLQIIAEEFGYHIPTEQEIKDVFC